MSSLQTPFSAATSITRPANTTAYSIGQVLSTATSGLTSLPSISLGIGLEQRAIITNAVLISSNGSASTKGQFDVYLFSSASPSGAGFNDAATFSPTAAALSAIGCDFLGSVGTLMPNTGTAAYGYQLINDTRQVLTDQFGNVYFAIVLANAYTPASGETITLKLSGVF